MGTKLMWTGIVLLLALPKVLTLVGLKASEVIEAAGAIIMVLALIAIWMDR